MRIDSGATAALVAAQEGHTGVLVALLTNGADVSLEDSNGTHPLLAATMERHQPCVEVLTQHSIAYDPDDSAPSRNHSLGHAQVVPQHGARLRDNTGT